MRGLFFFFFTGRVSVPASSPPLLHSHPAHHACLPPPREEREKREELFSPSQSCSSLSCLLERVAVVARQKGGKGKAHSFHSIQIDPENGGVAGVKSASQNYEKGREEGMWQKHPGKMSVWEKFHL